MFKKWFIIILTTPLFTLCYGQDQIETDRPDQSTTPTLVPPNYIQVEIGFNKENNKQGDYVLTHPTTLLKYSGNNWLEWRLETNIQSFHQKEINAAEPNTLFDPLIIGTKISLWEDKGIRPKTALLLNLSLPFLGKKEFRPNHIDPSFLLAMQNDLSPNISLTYNAGATWDGNASATVYFYSISPGFDLGKDWSVYVENFASFTKGALPDFNVDGGIAYLVNDNVRLDVSGGLGLSSNSLKNYVAVGIAYRKKVKK